MRVQLQGQTLRLRIDETELAQLLAGHAVQNKTRWPDGRSERQQVILAEHHGWQRDELGWCVQLADSAVRALVARLPTRDGLDIELPVPSGAALQLLFDVDVRDSARQRLHKHASTGDAP